MDNIAVYPGSFDPITNGHLDLLDRGLQIFEEVVVAIAVNPGKTPLFTVGERICLIEAAIAEHPARKRIRVEAFCGLLADFVKSIPARAALRGLRAVSDFECEFQMALMNRKLSADFETLFIMTGMPWIYISSHMIKDVVMSGGCVSGLVPELVEKKLVERLNGSAPAFGTPVRSAS